MNPSDFWITVNPFDRSIQTHKSAEDATLWAIIQNTRSEEHPAFRLYKCSGIGSEAVYCGFLYRRVGSAGFDTKDCWRF